MNGSVFPVGHYGGVRAGDTADAPPVHAVRIGWQQLRLTEDAFGVWLLAHGLSENGKRSWSSEDVLRYAEHAGVDDPAAELDGLIDKGAIAVVPDEPQQARTFARAHRMDIFFVGLGNAPDRPDGHAVGLPGLGTAAILDPDCYELWQWGSVAPSLWASCEVRASVTGQLGQSADPVTALGDILGDLRFLIAHGCAYLDVVATG